jgi:hypothetical protein
MVPHQKPVAVSGKLIEEDLQVAIRVADRVGDIKDKTKISKAESMGYRICTGLMKTQ